MNNYEDDGRGMQISSFEVCMLACITMFEKF